MAYSIEAIAEELNTVEFEVSPGKVITLKRMTARVHRRIEEQIPEPAPPAGAWKKAPGKGSEALIPDEHHPVYRAELDECYYRRQALQLVVALDLVLSTGDRWSEGMIADGARRFADQARAELESAFSPMTYARLINAMHAGASVGEKKAGGAEGN